MELCSWQCWLELCVWLTQETYPKSVLVFNLWTFRSWIDVYMHMYVPMSAILSVHVDICAWNKEYRRSALFLFSIPKNLPLLFSISVHEVYVSWQKNISLPLSLSYISSILYWYNRGIPIILFLFCKGGSIHVLRAFHNSAQSPLLSLDAHANVKGTSCRMHCCHLLDSISKITFLI